MYMSRKLCIGSQRVVVALRLVLLVPLTSLSRVSVYRQSTTEKYCKVFGTGELIALKRGIVAIPMPAKPTVAVAGQYLALALVYTVLCPHLKQSLTLTKSPWRGE